MATTTKTKTKRNQGKTEFVKEVLQSNPQANATKVREAWAAAGHGGSISQTLVNKQRSEMGLAGNLKGGRPKRSESAVVEKRPYTGKKRGRKPKSAGVNGHQAVSNGRSFDAPKAKTGGRQAQLSLIEAEIDRLLFRVMHIGGLADIEDSLRRTRRLLYQAVEGGVS
jgi:hypothetical protein